ncbi:DUF4870 domain-containing protein [Lacisediminihabitans profunda]|uniref:DUF4870 domain-containing protein n=1 Tax=Lacisediminihabitans profunda TaxID=2594790 RepID=A0A5C8UYZ0_9MICO|nr:DUF4870 domain-containing protein [Lacisediminihabitans profunda]TXN32848.1 DUF4870 domain-containing protein [Lacisediminihabitans profunda]
MSETTTPPGSPHQNAKPLSPADEKLWATLIHVGGIFFHFLPALIGYIVLKDRGPFVRQHTTAALNFQLTVLLGYVVGLFTIWILVGALILVAVAVVNIVFCIVAAVAADRGERYVYPMAITFIGD